MQGDPFINRKIDNYHVQYRMQDGGMSMVYKAYDVHREQDVVIKVLHDKYLNHPEVRERFEREIDIAKNLHHSFIVPFFGFGRIDGRPYIASKFMPGGSLNDVIKRGIPIPLGDIARWLRQIGSALDYAHKRGVIHRDIKPGNVLLDEAGDAALADFGIAHIRDATQLTRTDMAMPGTARFMSPEQAVGGETLNPRSDVYSLAVLAYMLTVGDYPFDGPSEVAIIIQHVDKQPPRPSQMNPDLPRSLDKVIHRGMAKHPDDRPPTAMAFAREFTAAIKNVADITTMPNPSPAIPRQASRPPNEIMTIGPTQLLPQQQRSSVLRRLGLLIIAAAVAVAIILGAVLGLAALDLVTDDEGGTTSDLSPTLPADIDTSVPAVVSSATPNLPPSVTPEPIDVPYDWIDGTQLFIQYQTGVSLAAGNEPVNPAQFQPGDVVTISRGLVEGENRREFFGGPDPESRWWHIALPEGGGGWLPESALAETPPVLESPPSPEATAEVTPEG
jgi:serine/threonine protein kinase